MKAELREGLTTGSCAAAASKAAATLLAKGELLRQVEIALPGGGRKSFDVFDVELSGGGASASIKKNSGDDPDVTNGMIIKSFVAFSKGDEVKFFAGEGVGTITKKGLALPPGEPAINPTPREMIRKAIKEVREKPFEVTVSIPGGEVVAQKTFNPRLGIKGGLSVLGTTGIVRPYSHPAIMETLKCVLDVAIASGVKEPVFTAGNIGTRAAKALGIPVKQIIEVGNEWGFMIDSLKRHKVPCLLAVGHPGKLAKLIVGDWDTHSSRSGSALPVVSSLFRGRFGVEPEESTTVEGFINMLGEKERENLLPELCERIAGAIAERSEKRFSVTVALVNMDGKLIGQSGSIEKWQIDQ